MSNKIPDKLLKDVLSLPPGVARRLFDTDSYLDIYDSMHSDSEDRGVIRILSARVAREDT